LFNPVNKYNSWWVSVYPLVCVLVATWRQWSVTTQFWCCLVDFFGSAVPSNKAMQWSLSLSGKDGPFNWPRIKNNKIKNNKIKLLYSLKKLKFLEINLNIVSLSECLLPTLKRNLSNRKGVYGTQSVALIYSPIYRNLPNNVYRGLYISRQTVEADIKRIFTKNNTIFGAHRIFFVNFLFIC